jgi:hypothetical protein
MLPGPSILIVLLAIFTIILFVFLRRHSHSVSLPFQHLHGLRRIVPSLPVGPLFSILVLLLVWWVITAVQIVLGLFLGALYAINEPMARQMAKHKYEQDVAAQRERQSAAAAAALRDTVSRDAVAAYVSEAKRRASNGVGLVFTAGQRRPHGGLRDSGEPGSFHT